MNFASPTRRPVNTGKLLLWLGLAAILCVLPLAAQAQGEPTPVGLLVTAPTQVLNQQQVDMGTHVLTLNRLAPPSVPSQATSSQAQTNSAPANKPTVHSVRARTTGRARTAQISAAATNDSGDEPPAKPYRLLCLSATVYDHQFSELRWYGGGNTPAFRVYVNLDFHLFAGVRTIETADAVYDLIFGLGDDTRESLVQVGQPVPDLSQFPADGSAYQVLAGSEEACPEEAAALAMLCAYHDAHRAQMAAAYQQRLLDEAAHAQWLQDHPPVPQDIVINYWPVLNSVFLNVGQ